jgi:hypothetical protein
MGPTLTPDAEIAHYPQDVQTLIRNGEQAEIDRFNHYVDGYSHSERNEAGYVTHYDKQGRIMDQGEVHRFFSLSYASWLVLPRVSLQEMPLDWQARFVALLIEADEKHGLKTPEGLIVQRQVAGKFVGNRHWNDYRRGSSARAAAIDEELYGDG